MHAELHHDPAGDLFRIIEPGVPVGTGGGVADAEGLDGAERATREKVAQPDDLLEVPVHEADGHAGA